MTSTGIGARSPGDGDATGTGARSPEDGDATGTGARSPEDGDATGTVSDGRETAVAGSQAGHTATPTEEVGRAFKSAMVAMRRLRGRETHHPQQLSYAQYGLLFGLAGMCERSARDLAEAADLSPATVTQMLEALESAGLVTRTRSDTDRRVVLNTLTERGEQLVAERRAQHEPRWQAALSEFSEQELLTAARVLDRLGEFFDSLGRGS